jgi:dipeptidyl aminopeptidase/acylaminoacyl peptidase
MKKCLLITLAFLSAVPVAWSADDPRRPAAIEAQDVPVVPSELAARLAQYQSVRGAAFRGWAPDGTGVLISTRFGNSSQLHRVYEPGGRREQITFFDEPVSGTFIPKGTDGAILMSMDSGGNENDQVLLLDRFKYQTVLLTDGKSRNKLGAIRHDGSLMAITSNQRNGRDVDIYLANPRQPGSMKMLMQVEKETWNVHDWSHDGKSLLISRYVSINESYPAILDIETGQRTEITFPVKGKFAAGPMAFTVDDRSILIAMDAQADFRRLLKYDLASKSFLDITNRINWDISDLAVEPTSGNAAFTVNEDGASKLYLLLHKGTGTYRELKLPLGIVSGLEFSPDGQRLGFTLARPDAPADVYSMVVDSGELTRWTFSEVGGLNPATFIAPTRIQFLSFDRRMIPAYYFKLRDDRQPAGARKPVPVYISIHGGPESQYQPFFSPIIQFYLNELGIAVICPNVRGSAGYGKKYLELDNAEKREDSVKDIGSLLDWIAKQPELDASRVAVAGGSYGGYMTLASLTNFGDRIKAGIDNVGIASFISFLERTAPYRVDLRRAEYGDERDPQMRAVFERIDPLNNTDKIRAALLVIHGRNDPRVPFFEAEQIAAKVRAGNRPVWTIFADNEGHGFAKKDNSDYQRAVEVLFLKKHLNLE